MKVQRSKTTFAVGFAIAAVLACAPVSSTVTIGAAGGSVTAGALQITIPAGALAADTEITVSATGQSAPAGTDARSAIFQLEPDGQTFAVPVTVALTFTGGAAGVNLFHSNSGGGYDNIGGTVSGSLISGQIGHFSTVFAGVITPGSGGGGGQTVAAGEHHSLAIKGGQLYVWGDNTMGQLGIGTADVMKGTPTHVTAGPASWTIVAADGQLSVGAGADGTLYQWGSIVPTGSANAPTAIAVPGNPTGWKCIATAGTEILAIDGDGKLWAMGTNGQGQLGFPADYADRTSMEQVPFPSGVTAWKWVSTHYSHTFAIASDGRLFGWGSDYGTLGLGTSNTTEPPTLVPLPSGVTGWTMVSTDNGHTLALTTDGRVFAWGVNNYGQCGTGTNYHPLPVSTPEQISTPMGPMGAQPSLTFVHVNAANNGSFLVASDGSTATFGQGNSGASQYSGCSGGGGNAVVTVQPTSMLGGNARTSAIGGGMFYLVGTDTEGVLTWGTNTTSYNELGRGAPPSSFDVCDTTPAQVTFP
jgi:alpha-tubulin suppressor-like RCC1 family protein